MKRTMSIKLAVIALLSALCLGGCSGYTSSYTASAMISVNTSKGGSIEFWTFNGSKVFELKNQNGSKGEVTYQAQLGSGSATVYYDVDGTKTEWFSLEGGDEVEGTQYLSDQGRITIIVESDGKCENGKFSFELE